MLVYQRVHFGDFRRSICSSDFGGFMRFEAPVLRQVFFCSYNAWPDKPACTFLDSAPKRRIAAFNLSRP